MAENDAVLVHCAVCGGWVTLGACACVFPPPVAPPVPGLYGPDNPVGIRMPELFRLVVGPQTQDRLARIEGLLATGVNVEQRGCTGDGEHARWYTPLAMAAIFGFVRVVELLLNNDPRADVHAHGRTILHLVARIGMDDTRGVAKLLLDHGADVHATDSEWPVRGFTALHEAAEEGHADVVQVLIHYGADVLARTDDGQTAQDLATSAGHVAVVAMIQTETLPRAKGVAFAMGLQERLGEASRVKSLDNELLRMVLEDNNVID
jgi:hypothetical protein